MNTSDAVELQIFIEAGCQMCERALRLAGEVDSDYPRLTVQVIDIREAPAQRDDVFAVPTFVLDGRVLSLGTPNRGQLYQEIEALLRQRRLV